MAYFFGDSTANTLSSSSVNSGMEMDVMYGGDGADTLRSWWNDDILDGGADTDFLISGQGNDFLNGDDGDDQLTSGTGNDTVNGGDGNDTVWVDLGDDVYIGGSGLDSLRFETYNMDGNGSDTNDLGVKIDLAKTTKQDLGALGIDQFFGFENVVGSSGNDLLLGSGVANFLSGDGGNDRIDGRGGDDVLRGFAGADVLIGGRGVDTIRTFLFDDFDGVRDRIDYNSVLDSGTTYTTRDVILGFDKGGDAGDDKIDLSTIDANPFAAGNQAFKFVGAFGARVGEVRCISSGGDTIIFIDTDRDKGAEMTIKVEDVTGLKAFDFIL